MCALAWGGVFLYIIFFFIFFIFFYFSFYFICLQQTFILLFSGYKWAAPFLRPPQKKNKIKKNKIKIHHHRHNVPQSTSKSIRSCTHASYLFFNQPPMAPTATAGLTNIKSLYLVYSVLRVEINQCMYVPIYVQSIYYCFYYK